MWFTWVFVGFAFVQPNFEARVEPLSFLQNSAVSEGTKYAPVVYGDHVINKVLNNFGWGMVSENYICLVISSEVHSCESNDVSTTIICEPRVLRLYYMVLLQKCISKESFGLEL